MLGATRRADQDQPRLGVPPARGADHRDPRPRPGQRPAQDRRHRRRGDPQVRSRSRSTRSSTPSRTPWTAPRPSWPPTSWTRGSCSPAALRSAGSTSGSSTRPACRSTWPMSRSTRWPSAPASASKSSSRSRKCSSRHRPTDTMEVGRPAASRRRCREAFAARGPSWPCSGRRDRADHDRLPPARRRSCRPPAAAGHRRLRPLQRGASAVVRPVADLAGGVAEVGVLREDNRRLEAEVARLRAQERTYADRGARTGACGGRCAWPPAAAAGPWGRRWWPARAELPAVGDGRRRVAPGGGAGHGRDRRRRAGRAGHPGDRRLRHRAAGHRPGPAGSRPPCPRNARNKAPGIVKGSGSQLLSFQPVRAGTAVRRGDPVVTQGYQGGCSRPGCPSGWWSGSTRPARPASFPGRGPPLCRPRRPRRGRGRGRAPGPAGSGELSRAAPSSRPRSWSRPCSSSRPYWPLAPRRGPARPAGPGRGGGGHGLGRDHRGGVRLRHRAGRRLLFDLPVGCRRWSTPPSGSPSAFVRVYVTSHRPLVHLVLAFAASLASVWCCGLLLRVFDLSSWAPWPGPVPWSPCTTCCWSRSSTRWCGR